MYVTGSRYPGDTRGNCREFFFNDDGSWSKYLDHDGACADWTDDAEIAANWKPITKGAWYDFVFHWVWGDGNNGRFGLAIQKNKSGVYREVVPLSTQPTLVTSLDGAGNVVSGRINPYFGIYRQRVVPEDETIWMDEIRRGPTFAAAAIPDSRQRDHSGEHRPAGDRRHDHAGADADRQRTDAWTSSPTSFAYLWQSCDGGGANCSAIGGATGGTYVLQAADVGRTVRVQVTATNGFGSGERDLRSDRGRAGAASGARSAGGTARADGIDRRHSLTNQGGSNGASHGCLRPVHAGRGGDGDEADRLPPGRRLRDADPGDRSTPITVAVLRARWSAVSQQVTIAAGRAAGLGRLPARDPGWAAGRPVLARLLVRRRRRARVLRQRRRHQPLRRRRLLPDRRSAGQLRQRHRLGSAPTPCTPPSARPRTRPRIPPFRNSARPPPRRRPLQLPVPKAVCSAERMWARSVPRVGRTTSTPPARTRWRRLRRSAS